MTRLFLTFTLFFLTLPALAAEVPRFASLSADKVFLRAGPGKQYPVKLIYQQRGYPVEIIREFDHWRKIQDKDGYYGWVYKGLLSIKRTALVKEPDLNDTTIWLNRYNDVNSQRVARVEPNAILYLKECDQTWCRGSSQGITGWIERKFLWGIYDNEIIE